MKFTDLKNIEWRREPPVSPFQTDESFRGYVVVNGWELSIVAGSGFYSRNRGEEAPKSIDDFTLVEMAVIPGVDAIDVGLDKAIQLGTKWWNGKGTSVENLFEARIDHTVAPYITPEQIQEIMDVLEGQTEDDWIYLGDENDLNSTMTNGGNWDTWED